MSKCMFCDEPVTSDDTDVCQDCEELQQLFGLELEPLDVFDSCGLEIHDSIEEYERNVVNPCDEDR